VADQLRERSKTAWKTESRQLDNHVYILRIY